jgi:hypothetical protein
MRHWISEPWQEKRHFEYRALGRQPAEMTAERIHP